MDSPKRPSRHGAEGSQWRRLVREAVDRDRGICHICLHTGARTGDHVAPLTERPDLALNLANVRAAHGVGNACPVCSKAAGKPVFCNNIKGGYSLERARRLIEGRTGLKIGEAAEPREDGRDW